MINIRAYLHKKGHFNLNLDNIFLTLYFYKKFNFFLLRKAKGKTVMIDRTQMF